MGLPSTGAISLDEIHVEAGGASGTAVSINDSDLRALAGKPSGPISFADFRGKSANIPDASTSGRRKANGYLAEIIAFHINTSGGTASAECAMEFQLRKITNGFEVRVRHVVVSDAGDDGANPTFWTNTGSNSSLNSSFRRVFVMTGVDLDSYKVNWTVTNGTLASDVNARYTDSNLKASDNVFHTNSVRYRVFRTQVATNSFANQTARVDLDFYGRKSGVPDKYFGKYEINLNATADVEFNGGNPTF